MPWRSLRQGRLPTSGEPKPLTKEGFRRILVEPEASLIKQYVAATKVTLKFSDDAIDALADIGIEGDLGDIA